MQGVGIYTPNLTNLQVIANPIKLAHPLKASSCGQGGSLNMREAEVEGSREHILWFVLSYMHIFS